MRDQQTRRSSPRVRLTAYSIEFGESANPTNQLASLPSRVLSMPATECPLIRAILGGSTCSGLAILCSERITKVSRLGGDNGPKLVSRPEMLSAGTGRSL